MNHSAFSCVLGLVTLGAALPACSDTDSDSSAPAGYASLCAQTSCATGSTPPDTTASYAGTGTTIATSNELWAVNESESFTATLDTTTPGVARGSFDMESFSVDVTDAQYAGEGDSFTIFGTDVFEDGNCMLGVKVVITGTRSPGDGALQGDLVLEFTDDITGSDCTPEVISGYPGAGAAFSYVASQTSGAPSEAIDERSFDVAPASR